MTELSPIYMWAGGKSRLIKLYKPIWPNLDNYDYYIEPFLGGGAVYCWLTNEFGIRKAIIGDINAELTGMLKDLRDDPAKFLKETKRLVRAYVKISKTGTGRKTWYINLRKNYWKKPTSAKLYVLMRTGFNGIWQTCKASNGLFGTPAGLLNHDRVEQILNIDRLQLWVKTLRRTTIHTGSYNTMKIPTTGRALIYLDPPYRDSFTSYGTGFSDEDQKKLITWAKQQVTAGHTVIIANRCVDGETFFEDLLPEGKFHYFDVTYTAGRRKQIDGGYEAKKAREFIVILGEIE